MKQHDEYIPALSALLDGELNETERAEVLSHLETCERCQAYFAELNAMRAAFGEPEEPDVPEGFAEGVMARLHAEAAPRSEPVRTDDTKKPKRRTWRSWAALAVCAAVVLGSAWRFTHLGMGGSSADSAAPNTAAAPSDANAGAAYGSGDGASLSGGSAKDSDDGVFAEEDAEEQYDAGAVTQESAPDAEVSEESAPQESEPSVSADGDAAAPNEALLGGEYLDVRLSGAGAADWLREHGGRLSSEAGGLWNIEADALLELPEGLTLGGYHAELVPELAAAQDPVWVYVRVEETEGAP